MSLFLAAALLAQSAVMVTPPLTVPAPALPSGDVGFNEIMANRPLAAIKRIEASELARKGDPLAMINLGTAYKMVGRKDEAARFYRTALRSDDRYDVQLANGRWIDSRRAATLAMSRLGTDEVLALR
jgi:Flp pilus assembly protein TadD